MVHFAKHKFARKIAGANQVIRQGAKAVGFFQVITKNAVTNTQRFERMYVARQSQLLEFQSFNDHVRLPKDYPWYSRQQ